MKAAVLVLHQDFFGRTCLLVSRLAGQVRFIAFDTTGISVSRLREADFDQKFKPQPDYPPVKAAQLYVRFAQDLGATQEAMEELSRAVSVSAEQIKAATTKTLLVRTEGGEVVRKTVVRGEKGKRAGGSASQLFQKLLIEGRLTDDQIFKEVQKTYGLADNRRSYVEWYRKKLVKDGKLEPDAPKPKEPKGGKQTRKGR